MENVTEFIETFYPNYHSCAQIARWNDLTVILNNEHVHGSIAYSMWLHEFDGIMSNVGIAYDQLNADILEKAIQGFINSNGPQCIKQVETIADYTTWEDKCKKDWEEYDCGMTFPEFLHEAQADSDWLHASDIDLNGIIHSSREIISK